MAGPTIDNAFVRQYESEVHEAYQREGSKCRMTVRTKNNVKGSSTTFQTVGKGTATTKARHGEIPPMNINHTPVTCTLTDHYAGEYIDKLDEMKVNHDERKVATDGGAMALGRKTDELIFTQAVTTSTVDGGSGIITLKRILAALEALQANDVPMESNELYGWLTPRAHSEMMNSIAQFTNADYVGVGQFANGYRARDWLGVKWMIHTGLPGVGTSSANCLIWHKNSIGHASGCDVKSDVQWIGPKAAHWVNNYMSQGSCLIDAEGVVKIAHDDTASLS